MLTRARSAAHRSTHVDRRRSAAATLAPALIVALLLAGCTSAAPVKSPTPTTSSTQTSTPSASSAPLPTLLTNGTAAENLPFFDRVNQQTLAAHPNLVGRDFIDGLVAAGFDKKEMLVTADKTTINLTPGSIQFSVKINGGCLIGQYGPNGVGYHSESAAPLATGQCLIGNTSPITW